MGNLGNKLLDPEYSPKDIQEEGSFSVSRTPYFKKIIKCPVKFTDDIVEYVESSNFLNMTLRPLQKKFLEELFSKDSEGNYLFSEGCFVAGMRSGKSWTAAFITTFMTQMLLQYDDPASYFKQAPGTRLTAQCMASSEVQAKETAYAAVESILDYSPWWKKYIGYLLEREDNEGKFSLYQRLKLATELPEKNLAILSLHSNSAALAGKTSYCVVLDELSRFDVADGALQSKTQKQTANAVYDTVSRSASSLYQISKVVAISSPMFEDDYTMQLLYKAGKCYVGEQALIINALRGKEKTKIPTLYGMHATTKEVNPDIPDAFLESKRIANPEAYRRDYLAIPPSTINPFFEFPERIDRVVVSREPLVVFTDKTIEETIQTDGGAVQRFYVGKTIAPLKQDKLNKYYVCVDQGESRDHFTLAMGHVEEVPVETIVSNKHGEVTRLKVVIDILTGWTPDIQNRVTVSFANVEEVIRVLCNYFNVGKVTYDSFSSVESIQRLFSEGIYTERLGANLEMYEVLKQLIYQGQVELPPHELLKKELKQLTLLRGIKIEHLVGGSKDYADAVVRVCWCCYNDYIMQTVFDQHILPHKISLPTLRSVASAYEVMQQSEMNPHGAIWDNSGGQMGPIGGQGVFGETTIVRQNIMPNMGKGK